LISPSVAVVIPFHNGSAWVERAILSATSQSHPPKEIVVIDDGSASAELEKLMELKPKYPIKVYTQENAGQSAARNLGISLVSSEYICLLDQDDYFLPDHIITLLEVADLSDRMFGYSYGDLKRVSESGEVLSDSCVNVNTNHPHTDWQTMFRNNMYVLPSATLIKRSAILAVGGFDETLQGYEDDDLFLRFFLAGYTSRFTTSPVSAWTVNLSSTSFSETMSRSGFLYFKKLLRVFPSGSVGGEKVFGRFLFPRFANKIAGDVAAAALSENEYFSERVDRLKYIRGLTSSSGEVDFWNRILYLVLTFPLVSLGPRAIRFTLICVLKMEPVLRVFRVPLLEKFLDRHSLTKIIVT
jgi:glycosyltransferase involved in cell wall biosynthesis